MSLGYGLDDRGFGSWHSKELYLFSKTSTPGSGAYPASYLMCTRAISLGKSGRGENLTAQRHLVTKFRMSGVILLLPLYAFIASRRTVLLLLYVLTA